MNVVQDRAARLAALTELDRSMLVEAGAGSGKTSLLAGRVVGLLARGVKPANIASVSFTELAASELVGRINDFATGLARGVVPRDIADAFPEGLSAEQSARLAAALPDLGEMTCTTIHGFCQALLRPYPVEAGIDPGATVLDPDDATLIFDDVLDSWLRARLSGSRTDEDVITATVTTDPKGAVTMIETIARELRGNPEMRPRVAESGPELFSEFDDACGRWRRWSDERAVPPEHAAFDAGWGELVERIAPLRTSRMHAGMVGLSVMRPGEALSTKTAGFRKYRLKTAWKKVSKTDAEDLCAEGERLFAECCEAFLRLQEKAAAVAFSMLVEAVRPVLSEFAERKRAAAFLDFDDLLHTARDLLRDHPEVRADLKRYYTHVLVDEFQDTDPVQTDIFEMLCFEDDGDGGKRPRPGAIFFVGDPKQSIYRFRGADVGTYVRMREQMRKDDPESVKSIFMNFRSMPGIIDFVNRAFEEPLSKEGQPGFTPLAPNRSEGLASVMKFQAHLEASADERRRHEAEQVAEAVRGLIGDYEIALKDGSSRPCEPRDIALLAPVNTNLFWLENALEERGIAVSTQAGKGLFQQQEVKDLIALTRVLADGRDTLALGALLRGSFFGFTEAELLDAAHALPARQDGRLSHLTLDVPLEHFTNAELGKVVAVLASLRAKASSTTPFDVLSEGVEFFDVRAKTRNRDQSNSARRLANIERFLEMSRAYDARGMRAFSDSMRQKWEDSERVQEGRAGGVENSVSIITIHSAKGLEWPVVFTVNSATEFNSRQTIFRDARDASCMMRFLKAEPCGYQDYVEACRREDRAEHVRLMYVALTRARDLLVVPDIPARTDEPKAWADLVEVGHDALDYVSLPRPATHFRPPLFDGPTMSKERYSEMVERIARGRRPVRKIVPSSHEWRAARAEHVAFDELAEAPPNLDPYAGIAGGVERGNVLHKLMEEVCTGELPASAAEVEVRADELIRQVRAAAGMECPEIHPRELSGCVMRTLALPEVAALMPRLVPEVAVSQSTVNDDGEFLKLGVADAVAFDGDIPEVVVDWKSDLRPSAAAVANYRSQVNDYRSMIGARRGLIVFMSLGRVEAVEGA